MTSSKLSDVEAGYLAAIVESSDDAIIAKSPAGIVTSWNKAAETMFGYRADEIAGQPISLLIPPDWMSDEDLTETWSSRRLGAEKKSSISRRYGAGRMAGTFQYRWRFRPFRDPNGTVVGASKIIRDITERVRGEQANREAAMQLRTVADTVVDGLILIDSDGSILMFNRASEHLFGYSSDDVIGQNIKLLMPSLVLPVVSGEPLK
jgi:two-component system, LuxR family, sensor kinase FixL